jgi:hypothetical protein
MHVRWKKCRPQSGVNGKGINLEALLVESYQDKGSVKHHMIERLGAIEEKFPPFPYSLNL